jgi:hypothetical protein
LLDQTSRSLDPGSQEVRTRLIALVAVTSVLALPVEALASTKVLRVTPHRVNFGAKPSGSFTLKSVVVTNMGSETIALTVDVIKEWDDFTVGFDTTCLSFSEPERLAPGESCVVEVGFRPSEFFEGLKQDQILLLTATDPVTGDVLDSQEVVFVGRGR